MEVCIDLFRLLRTSLFIREETMLISQDQHNMTKHATIEHQEPMKLNNKKLNKTKGMQFKNVN